MAAYNEALCKHEHVRIEQRFEKGEMRMDTHEILLNRHNESLAVMQKLADRQANVFWQMLSPALSTVGGIITGLVLAYLLTN